MLINSQIKLFMLYIKFKMIRDLKFFRENISQIKLLMLYIKFKTIRNLKFFHENIFSKEAYYFSLQVTRATNISREL